MPETEPIRSRTFGLELEFKGERSPAVRSLQEHGFQVESNSNYTLQPRDGMWGVCSDVSIGGGWELKSPVLNWYRQDENGRYVDRESIRTAVMAIGRSGARTTPTGGIHVHIGVRDLSALQVARVVCFFAKFEDSFYRIASSGWSEIRPSFRNYCPPLQPEQYAMMNKAKDARSLQRAWGYNIGSGGRRHGINLEKYWRTGTVEFRVFNTSLNPDRVRAYVALCVGVIQDAIYCKRAIRKAYRLGDMAAGRADPEYVRHAFLGTLRHTTKTVKNLEKEDLKLLNRFWKDSVPQAAWDGNQY